MPKKITIVRWEPRREPMSYTVHYAIENPTLMAEISVKKLQAELLGRGCGCHRAEELIALLRDLGVEIEIVEGPGGNGNAN
jgi:hypothetical protein